VRTHEETHARHGRIETRRIELGAMGHVQWPGLKQWGRITRTRVNRRTGKITTQQICFITSLGSSQASPEELLAYNRNHWAIENRLHWVKDTLLREDVSTIRTGAAPQTAAALRNAALRALRGLHASPTQAREIAADDKNSALQLLGCFVK
jgi:predicted transposase YbfD/YdcC